jgi:hypothetical protein
MRNYAFALALGAPLCIAPGFAVPYVYVWSGASFTAGLPTPKPISRHYSRRLETKPSWHFVRPES